MRVALNKSLSVLLGLFLVVITAWQGGSAVASQDSRGPAPTCHCCNSDRTNCATPACCARLWVANSHVGVHEVLLIDLPPAIAAFKLPSHEGTFRGICA